MRHVSSDPTSGKIFLAKLADIQRKEAQRQKGCRETQENQ
jgi:hypothetical protein